MFHPHHCGVLFYGFATNYKCLEFGLTYIFTFFLSLVNVIHVCIYCRMHEIQPLGKNYVMVIMVFLHILFSDALDVENHFLIPFCSIFKLLAFFSPCRHKSCCNYVTSI